MLTVEDYGQIRRAHRDGMGIRAMARAFHRSRCKIREALAHPQPQGYTRSKDPPAPKLDPFKSIIDGILKANEQAPPKQRHTAITLWQIHRDRTREYRHPTQKPLALGERAIRNSSRRGESVLDLFLGSGSTLIAAERLERRCFGLEIDPLYCDAIVRRYLALLGPEHAPSPLLERYQLPAGDTSTETTLAEATT